MTVDFALFLSPQGIALAHRQPQGHWALVGEVAFENADLPGAMAELKAAATARGGNAAPVLLVLPDDQILYTSLTAPSHDAEQVEARIVDGLDGLTPYPVSDLVYDWRPIELDRVKVAVIARETLEEAAGFAAEHGFDSAGFAAMPPAERFPGMPVFGTHRPEMPDLVTGMAFGGDHWVDPSTIAPPEPDPPQVPTEIGAQDHPDSVSPDAPLPVDDAPAQAVSQYALPLDASEAEATAEEETLPPAVATDTAAPEDLPNTDTSLPAPAQDAPANAAPGAADSPVLVPIFDSTLERPVTPITQADDDRLGTVEGGASEPQATDPSPDTAAPPSALIADPKAAPEPIFGPDLPPEAGATPTASRGKVARPATGNRALSSAGKPGASAAAAALPTPEPPIKDGAPTAPLLGFGARRGKAVKPETDAGSLISNRRTRFGFGPPAANQAAPLHPDTAASVASDDTATPDRPGSKLAAQLARVRDASKARPKADGMAPAPVLAESGSNLSRDKADTPPQTGAAALIQRAGAKAVAVAGISATADAAVTGGLLARKGNAPIGGSLRAGLILTVILLVLLALIAIWSVLFLPDSPVARLLGGGGGSVATEDVAESAATPSVPITATIDPETEQELAGPAPTAPAPASPDIAAPAQPSPAAVARTILPDIDAEFDLPPLPSLPQDALPSLEETEQIYAEDGIWPRPPDPPFFSPFSLSDEIYIASIDPEVTSFDAVALGDPRVDPSEMLRAVPPPPGFGTQIARDARGLVAATPEGVLTPEGAFVVLGRPPVAALPRPREIAPITSEQPVIDPQNAVLSGIRPQARPGDLDETRERQVLGGFSATELAGLRPALRPTSAQESAAQASLFPDATDAASPEAEGSPAAINGTERAIASSRVPTLRPTNFAEIVAEAQSDPAPVEVAVASAIAAPPSIPSNADVSRAATERNAIRLRDINLIGVTGTPSNRSALVRLPSGRFVRVGVGDRLDGGRVAAIGESSLQYVINGRNVTLEIPG